MLGVELGPPRFEDHSGVVDAPELRGVQAFVSQPVPGRNSPRVREVVEKSSPACEAAWAERAAAGRVARETKRAATRRTTATIAITPTYPCSFSLRRRMVVAVSFAVVVVGLGLPAVMLHVSNVLRKLQAPNRTTAAMLAVRHGLVDRPSAV